jgi:hypothetical protein
MQQLMRLLREPLFHFLVIGGLLFGLYAALSGPAPTPVNRIVVSPERVAQLAAGYETVWRRPPSDDELRTMVDNFVREEVYYREALALGLERDDTVIRRRLQQKMEFFTDNGADLIAPSAGELDAFYQANEQRFQEASRIAMVQIFFGQNATPESIAAALTALQSDSNVDLLQSGERTLLPPQMALSTPAAIDGVFGAGFFDDLKQLPTNRWVGPVESGFGVHLVRIDQSVPGRVPPLAEVHDVILGEWKTEKAIELREKIYSRLRERYIVELPDNVGRLNP